MTSPISYADSGVDIDAGNKLVKSIGKVVAQSLQRKGSMSSIGGFGGLFDIKAAGYKDPILVAATDGVGTKLKIAIDTGFHETIGQDLVAMCVNDLLAMGAEPLFFLDYYATGKLENHIAEKVIAGIAKACVECNTALIGGETAELPGLYHEGDYDLAGFAVGALERGTELPLTLQKGDVLIGLPSTGVHSNGYSLARKIIAKSGLRWEDIAPFDPKRTMAEAFLAPTALYVQSLIPLIREGKIKAFAHITGGGITENLPRILPKGFDAEIDLTSWELPKLFQWLGQTGPMIASEMLKTFNCGVGGVIVVSENDVDEVLDQLKITGQNAFKIGQLISGDVEPSVKYLGIDDFETAIKPVSVLASEVGKVKKTAIGILISGRGSNMVALLDAMQSPDYPARCTIVISDNEDAKGLEIAAARGIKTAIIPNAHNMSKAEFETQLNQYLEDAGVEIICGAGFMRVLSKNFCEQWKGKLLNIHPSLLPAFKGLNTHERALESGVKFTGATVHLMNEDVDSGQILDQIIVEIDQHETPESLQVKTLSQEHILYPRALRKYIQNGLKG